MDKITHQVRAEHWAKIMNECINSGMSKTAWCRATMGSQKNSLYISEELTIPHDQSDHLSRRFRSLISERDSLRSKSFL